MMELLVDNRNGTVWNLVDLVSEVTWKTSRLGKPSSLEFGILKDDTFVCNNGDVVRFRYGGHNVFYGYVFAVDESKDEKLTIIAYDQLRYLLANDTKVAKNATATQIISQICADMNMKVGYMVNTNHVFPTFVEDGKKLLEICHVALDRTLTATNSIYILYDDFGLVTLRNANDLNVDIIIGDGSLMVNWAHKRSIDSDTYNRIKLIRDNKDTGKRDVYIAQDSVTISRWGRLQYYQSIDENLNTAQINVLLTTLLAVKNREKRSLKVDALGDIRVRAGWYLPIQIAEIGVSQRFLIDECTHKISASEHTMQLNLKVI